MSTAGVKELVGMPTLPITKGLMSKMSETPTPGGYIGPKETLGSEQELLAQKETATEALGKADIEVERAKQQQKTSELEIDAQSKKDLVQSLRNLPEKTALDEKNEKLKNLAFVPTKDTVQDIAGLFSLINVIGMAVGGGGKQNAQLAMHAMNGMAEGYQKGRADLYRKEQIEFDKNFKAMQAAVQTLEKDYTRAVELEKTNKEAGRIERQVALARANSPILKAMEDRLGVAKTLETIKDLVKSKDTAVDKFNSLKKIEDDKVLAERKMTQQVELARQARLAADERARLQREQQLKLAELKSKGGGTLKPGAKIQEGYIADNILKADVQDIKNDLKNPELVAKLKKYQIEAFLTEEGKVLNQLLAEDIPPDLQRFLTKVIDVRNNYYANISGKAVTGGEALRNYGAVPQPGDTAERILNKLDGISNRIDQQIGLKQEMFGLPTLNLKAGMKTTLTPNEDYSIGSQKTYEVNKVYTDNKGNKARYLGNDEWEEQ
jgi:hypothetical protein